MINILSYIGMSLQSEVCLWTLLGLVRTIFDATLFKVNANLKQVWQMSMPEELSRPVQRVLRTMISGIMLVQCFTVYVYLASYIVLLYPVFLEERPTLVLPWLLLAAIRKLLCELTSLALGLGTCVLLGPARPPCIKFLVIKVASIMPSFYMWMLLYSYYHVLKVASVFKSFPVVLPPSEHDYGLELAVRRRRTKSLLGEQQLRTSLIANLYNEHHSIVTTDVVNRKPEYSSRMTHGTDTSQEDLKEDISIMQVSTTSNRMIPDTSYEDWFGGEVMIHRDTDRILEQFGLMMLRIGAYLTRENADSNATSRQIFDSTSSTFERRKDTLDSAHIPADDTDPPPLVGSVNGRTASYLRDYPQIFMKKTDIPLPSDILSLASDDMMVSSQKHRSQTQHDNNKSTSTDPNVSDHHAFKHDESQLYAQKKNSKETAKKLQTSTSEKSVAFRELKNTLTLESKESKNSLKFIEEAVETGSDIQNSFVKDENKAQRKPSGQLEEEVDIKIEASSTSLLRRNQETNTSNISTSIDPKMRKSKKKDA